MSFMDSAALLALSPIDGRYRKGADPLRAVLSESGLIRERVRIEAAWLLSLAESVPELVHFGCTSEDINNLAYARMLRAARAVLTGELEKVIERLRDFAHEHAE